MKKDNLAKENILKGIKRKLRLRTMKIIGISILSCIGIAFFGYYILFVQQHPLRAEQFSDVSIKRVVETINEMDNRELTYNHLNFTVDQEIWYSLIQERDNHFYIEKNKDNQTSSLYFYLSESYVQRYQNKKFRKDRIEYLKSTIQTEEEYNRLEATGAFDETKGLTIGMLLNTKDCNTDIETVTTEITKVYYLVYNYEHIKPEKFNRAKEEATLLWEKDAN